MTNFPRTACVGAAIATALSLGACAPAAVGTGGIPAGEYVMVGMDGATVPLRNVTLVVQPGSISGNGPCNAYSASNNADLPQVSLSPIISTKVACKDSRIEQRFFAALQSATEMEFYGGVLKVKSPQTWLIFEHGHRADQTQVSALEAARGAP